MGGVYGQSHVGTQALLVAVLLLKALCFFVWTPDSQSEFRSLSAAGPYVKSTWVCRTTLSQTFGRVLKENFEDDGAK